jgi:hypothetical protein
MDDIIDKLMNPRPFVEQEFADRRESMLFMELPSERKKRLARAAAAAAGRALHESSSCSSSDSFEL